MQNKYLRFLVLVFGLSISPSILLAEGASVYEHRLLGKCFGSANEFISAAFGEGSHADPNIEITKSNIQGKQITWVVDKTPTSNYQWFLLDNSGGLICLRLFVPAASLVEEMPKQKNKPCDLRMRAFIGPGPGFPAKEMIFLYSEKRQVFQPEHCTGTWFNDKGIKKYSKKISCEKILN